MYGPPRAPQNYTRPRWHWLRAVYPAEVQAEADAADEASATGDLVWDEPPGRPRGGGNPQVIRREAWQREAAALRAEPGRWGRLPLPEDVSTRYTYTLADNIRRGRLLAFREGTWSARASDGKVWARYEEDQS
jgi:hypothetical protein